MTTICPWAANSEIETQYHDTEWGVPVLSDEQQFEFLTLESAQAGLSWLTILRRREGYRAAFSDFIPTRVAAYTTDDIDRLVTDTRIIRHRGKIEAAVNNARVFLEIASEYGTFCNFIWNYVEGRPIQNTWRSMDELPAHTPLASRIAKDMKQRGFKFLGPTTIYAHMQAAGLVNDHLVSCFRYETIRAMGEKM